MVLVNLARVHYDDLFVMRGRGVCACVCARVCLCICASARGVRDMCMRKLVRALPSTLVFKRFSM